MARGYVKTIRDLEELYYGGSAGYVLKSDSNVISTTTGVYNPIKNQSHLKVILGEKSI